MIEIKCNKCHKILTKPGALFFSPSEFSYTKNEYVTKKILCCDCSDHVLNWINSEEELEVNKLTFGGFKGTPVPKTGYQDGCTCGTQYGMHGNQCPLFGYGPLLKPKKV